MCLSSVRPGKPLISKNFYLKKPVCPRNINSSTCIRSSNACQVQGNFNPSKSVLPNKPVRKPVCKPVFPNNVTPSKPVRPSNTILSKTACTSKVYSNKLIWTNKFVQVNLAVTATGLEPTTT